jgi:tetratricopeptide (TPR) repeat protein
VGQKGDQIEELARKARSLGSPGKRAVEAVKVNTRILELDPDNLAALTRRGLCYLKLDNYPAAKEDLSRALRIYPGSSLVQQALGKIERGWYAALERARRRAEKRSRRAEEEWAQRRREEELRAVEQLTDFEEAYALGVAASKASYPNYPLAIAAFKKAYRLDSRRKVRPGERPDPGRLREIVEECAPLPGYLIFKYYDEARDLNVTSGSHTRDAHGRVESRKSRVTSGRARHAAPARVSQSIALRWRGNIGVRSAGLEDCSGSRARGAGPTSRSGDCLRTWGVFASLAFPPFAPSRATLRPGEVLQPVHCNRPCFVLELRICSRCNRRAGKAVERTSWRGGP